MNKKTTAFFAVASVAALAGAFLYQGAQDTGRAPQPPAAVETSDPIPPQVKRADSAGKKLEKATVYRVVFAAERSQLDPVEVTLPSGKEPMAAALDAMAALKDSPLPAGTKVRSVTMTGNGVAHVDFNGAFRENFPGGNEEEAITINAVLATMAQFFGVESVKIMVNGETIESLGGHQELLDPLPVDDAVRSVSGKATRTARNMSR